MFFQITFQLVVMTAAVMFIFLGIPLLYCLAALPCVMLFIYIAIYVSFYSKAMELLMSKRPLKCWVAEVYLPYFFRRDPKTCRYDVVWDEKEIVDAANFKKTVCIQFVFILLV